MELQQVARILVMAKAAYPNKSNYYDDDLMLEVYHAALSDMDPRAVLENFNNHVKKSKFFPTVNDLRESVKNSNEGNPHIPGVEETTLYIESISTMKTDLTEKQINNHLDNIRKILFKPRLEEDYE